MEYLFDFRIFKGKCDSTSTRHRIQRLFCIEIISENMYFIGLYDIFKVVKRCFIFIKSSFHFHYWDLATLKNRKVSFWWNLEVTRREKSPILSNPHQIIYRQEMCLDYSQTFYSYSYGLFLHLLTCDHFGCKLSASLHMNSQFYDVGISAFGFENHQSYWSFMLTIIHHFHEMFTSRRWSTELKCSISHKSA